MPQRFVALCMFPLLAACADLAGTGQSTIGAQASGEPLLAETTRSQSSFEVEAFFTRVETNLLARGLLRADGGGPDSPFTDEMLARNFENLAFSEEFSSSQGQIIRRSAESTLHRWATRVRVEPIIGPSVSVEQAEQDTRLIANFVDRLARVTNHPIQMVPRNGNFQVLILNDQELRNSAPPLRKLMPELSLRETNFVEQMSRDTYCVVFASDPGQDGRYERAVAVIRAELPDVLRTSCIHEEIAQGLGLSNDSASARPSIFNDDDEFGRLTYHDELLLQILYDERLQPGMSLDESSSIVRSISRTLLAPNS